MGIGNYLKDKLLYLFLYGMAGIFMSVFLSVLGLGRYPVFFLEIIWMLALFVPLLCEYRKKKKFYSRMMEDLKALDKKYYLSEMVEEPLFLEGDIFCDVLYQANKSMNDEIGKYKKASKEYREYIEMWMHEIKTPIASLQLLIDNHQTEFVREIESEIQQVDYYLEQVLYYAKSSSPEKDYLIKKVSLQSIIQDTLKLNSKVLIRNKVQIVLQDLEYKIYTDVKWTQFIISQILINAVKYRSESPVVEINAWEQEGNITVRIKDNGIGISASDLPRVFEKGYTGTTGRIYGKSTGMGLYLCRELGIKLQIPVEIDSAEGEYTAVRLTFMKNKYYAV